uniref:Uncharacterized protein n=1 Tax=Heterorhabditis bacteriophora TaxID=37862 RepID=A0A1I7WB09_HETBA
MSSQEIGDNIPRTPNFSCNLRSVQSSIRKHICNTAKTCIMTSLKNNKNRNLLDRGALIQSEIEKESLKRSLPPAFTHYVSS